MSVELVGERTLFRRLRYTPMRDVVRGRLTGRLDSEAMIAAADLPDPLPELVRDVTRRTRLFRLEKVAVAEELCSHFRDGLNDGQPAAELARDFGDPVQAARMIGRAKRRNRPPAFRAAVRSLQATGGLVGLLLLLYGISAIRFFAGTPNPTVDFLRQLNATTLAALPTDRAWPEYRAAILSLGRPPELSYGRTPRPGEPGWDIVDDFLVANGTALDHVRAAAARPLLGYTLGSSVVTEDGEMWPDQPMAVEVAESKPLFRVMTVHLVELRRLVPLLADDSRRLAAAGESEAALANVDAMLSMAEQVLGSGVVHNDLAALPMFTMALDLIGELLHDYPSLFSDEQLTTLAHRLDGMAGGAPIPLSRDVHRAAFADILQHAYTDNGRGDGHLTWEGLRLLMRWSGETKTSDPLVVAAGPLIAALGVSRARLLEKYDELLAMVHADAAVPLWERGPDAVEIELERMASSRTELVRYLPITLLMPAPGRGSVLIELVGQRRDAMMVAIALQLYMRRHAAWPSDLADLTPLLLPVVPPDRFDGAPIKYTMRDAEPVIYVAGTDRDDDGGRTPPPPRTDKARFWRPPDVVARAAEGDASVYVVDGDWVLWPPADPEPLGVPQPHKARAIYQFQRHHP